MVHRLRFAAAVVIALATSAIVALGAAEDDADHVGRAVFGSTVSVRPGESIVEARARIADEIGEPPIVRLYSPGAPPAWDELILRAGDAAIVVSFKFDPAVVLSGAADARLRAWFAAAPTDRDVYWVYFHEPEDNIEAGAFTAGQFRAAWRHIDWLAQQASSTRLFGTVVLMCWTLDDRADRTWTDYVPAGPPPDVLAWDCYNRPAETADGYASPDDLFDASVDVSEQVGSRWAIGELGSVLAGGDDGSGRAAWLRSVADYSRERDAAFVTYFHSMIDGAYALNDPASQQAWREIMAS